MSDARDGREPHAPGSPLSEAASKVVRVGRRVGSRMKRRAEGSPLDVPMTAGRPPKSTRQRPSPREVAARRAYWRVARRVVGAESFPAAATDVDLDPESAKQIARQAATQRAHAHLAESLTAGVDPMDAYVETLRRLLAVSDDLHGARALTLATGSLRIQDPAAATALGLGLVLTAMYHFEQAWVRFAGLDLELLRRFAPVEAMQAALVVGTDASVAVARELASDASALSTSDAAEMAGRLVATGHLDLARSLVAEVRRRDPEESTSAVELARTLGRWVDREPAAAAAEATGQGSLVTVGVIDYYQPDLDRSSLNVGDYVQTLAMLGNLARFRSLRFVGDDGLDALSSELQGRVRPELHLDGPAADVHLIPVSRDFSEGDDLPPNTWMVAFGWHMHSMFRMRFGLPYHPHINPVFVSFHVNRVGALTPETVEYLKAHGPIGCRDWTTVDLLLSAGVDAFFTGCLTTTVNAVFPPLEEVEREEPGVVALIDTAPKHARPVARRLGLKVEQTTHADAVYRDLDLVQGTRAASDLLERYQRRFAHVVTSRLHSYLPATSLGLAVTFVPDRASDVRFEGLTGMTPEAPEFAAIRDGIRALLAEVFGLVLAGADRETVYARWREVTADRVVEAKQRLAMPPTTPAIEAEPLVAPVRAAARSYGPEPTPGAADVVLSLDANFRALLPVTLESLVSNATGPLRLWITTRGLGREYEQWVSDAFPSVPMTFLPCDDVDHGDIKRMIGHISVATMDRLLLPEMLPDLDRVVYVDIDTVTTGDVCELARLDLEGHPLAARTTWLNGPGTWQRVGNLLSYDDAAELRRTMASRHPLHYLSFNAGVMVLDLDRLRRDRFVQEYLPWAYRFGLNDQDLLLAYAGPGRAELPLRWNAMPIQEEVTEPGIVHYAGAGKPWGDRLVPRGELWREWAERSHQRAGSPPA